MPPAQFLKRSRQNIPADQKVKREDTMVVGRDMRPSSPDLRKRPDRRHHARSGMNVIDIGMIDTSMIYFAINHLDAVGGIQTTASHNPIQYNGFKISGPKAKPIGAASGLDDIKRIATTLRVGQTGVKGTVEQMDLWPQYREHVLQVPEAGPQAARGDRRQQRDGRQNGAGGLRRTCRTSRSSRSCSRSPASFVHEPNPLVESNLDMLKAEDPRDQAGPRRLLRRRRRPLHLRR